MADSASTTSITALIAAMAILPPLLGNLLTWAKDLSGSATRQRKVEEATKHIAFWDTWTKAIGETRLTEEERERSLVRMRQIALHIDRLEKEHPEFGNRPERTSPIRKFLLLQPMTPLQRYLRLYFWLYLAAAPLAGPMLIRFLRIDKDAQHIIPLQKVLDNFMLSCFAATCFCLIGSILFRRVTIGAGTIKPFWPFKGAEG